MSILDLAFLTSSKSMDNEKRGKLKECADYEFFETGFHKIVIISTD